MMLRLDAYQSLSRALQEAVVEQGLLRSVFANGHIDTPTYNRPDLASGDVVSGPAIIEEFGSTVPVHPGFAVTVDAYGNLMLTKESAL